MLRQIGTDVHLVWLSVAKSTQSGCNPKVWDEDSYCRYNNTELIWIEVKHAGHPPFTSGVKALCLGSVPTVRRQLGCLEKRPSINAYEVS